MEYIFKYIYRSIYSMNYENADTANKELDDLTDD